MINASNDLIVIIPTYNERENIHQIISELQGLDFSFSVLFVDDNSPDGTGLRLSQISTETPGLHVLHRSGKLGIGSAHKAGLRWSYENGFRLAVTMDCDLTHNPDKIQSLVTESNFADIVVASRFLKKNSLPGWSLERKFLTIFGHVLTKICLGIPYDATGALRCYRLDRIPYRIFDDTTSSGYAFFCESLFLLSTAKFSIVETPIELPARTYGHSKMSRKEILKTVRFLLSILIRRNLVKARTLAFGLANDLDSR